MNLKIAHMGGSGDGRMKIAHMGGSGDGRVKIAHRDDQRARARGRRQSGGGVCEGDSRVMEGGRVRSFV